MSPEATNSLIENSTKVRNARSMEIVPDEPVLCIPIKPKTTADAERLERGLTKLASEDPTFRAIADSASGQTNLKGTDELHLDILVSRLLGEFMVEAEIGAPSIVYRRVGEELLEPIMKVEVATPEEFVGIVAGNIRARRGKILDLVTLGSPARIEAFVPLANMSGYLHTLHSMSSGLASFSMQFDHYAACPEGSDPDDSPPFAITKRA